LQSGSDARAPPAATPPLVLKVEVARWSKRRSRVHHQSRSASINQGP
jgi:hypothetical protein